MVNGVGQEQDGKIPPGEEGEILLKPYQKPILEELGDLRDITLGGSFGAGESGVGSTRNFKSSHRAAIKSHNLPDLFELQKTEQVKKKKK